MKDEKRIEIVLNVIKRISDKNFGIQKSIECLTFNVCKEKSVTPEQAFFILIFFAAVFIIIGCFRKNLNKIVKDINYL